ncbi:hypothetical protein JG687_00006635 [Phytophthora cactorum]|uniref:Mediator complex subunit 15 KIX domain-containing protein n=1 Tax=Phytophthora cactorum TaxID=29920 RepID=A0A8T1UM06_9STRA|nr:hypothetical protein JG687_00006635 [Phytophthora cactorum]
MDSSHAFVGDFSMNMNGGDNRFLNQFNLGGGGTVNSGTMGGMDLFGGLDFSSGMNLMTDSSMMLGGNSSTSTAGLIDFPDELNSPTTSSSGPSSSSLMMDTSVSMMTASSAPMSSTTDAIPFPASLASESLTNSGTSSSSSSGLDPQASTQNTGTPPTSTRPAWQSSADQALRKEMLNHIMRVLQNQRSNAPANWLQKLPEMAHRLEDECYRIASSREEYANTSTLQSRLRSIVRSAQTHQRSVGANAMRQPNQASPANNRPATSTSAATPIPFPGVQAVASTSNGVSSDVNDLAAQAIQMPPELQDPPSQVNTPVKAEAAQAQGLLQSTPSALDSAMTDRLSMSGPQTASSPASAARNKSAQIIWQFKAKAQQVTSALDKNQTTEYHNKLRLMVRDDVKTPGHVYNDAELW